IAHVGAQTRTIRLGAGGVMLPNHAPLLIAEQFGTLAAMYPDRIDLGLGRAPGGDQSTMNALRRDPHSADTFPEDVLELQGYLTSVRRARAVGQFGRQFGLVGPDVNDERADEILAGGAAPHVDETLTHTAAGTPDHVRDSLDRFLGLTNADELITVHPAPTA